MPHDFSFADPESTHYLRPIKPTSCKKMASLPQKKEADANGRYCPSRSHNQYFDFCSSSRCASCWATIASNFCCCSGVSRARMRERAFNLGSSKRGLNSVRRARYSLRVSSKMVRTAAVCWSVRFNSVRIRSNRSCMTRSRDSVPLPARDRYKPVSATPVTQPSTNTARSTIQIFNLVRPAKVISASPAHYDLQRGRILRRETKRSCLRPSVPLPDCVCQRVPHIPIHIPAREEWVSSTTLSVWQSISRSQPSPAPHAERRKTAASSPWLRLAAQLSR